MRRNSSLVLFEKRLLLKELERNAVRQVHRAQGHLGSSELYHDIRRHVADWETSIELSVERRLSNHLVIPTT